MLKKLTGSYLALTSLAAHVLVMVFVISLTVSRFEQSEMAKTFKRTFFGNLDGVAVTQVSSIQSGTINKHLLELQKGKWHKIHQQADEDLLVFNRQAHGGSAFDSRRGRLILFGSDTHGENWYNAPYFFDMSTLQWSTPYPSDSPSSYSIDINGNAIAGENGEHPWAMHTFDALAYHPVWDALIVASKPKHLSPGRFTDSLKSIWSRVRHHPTWIFSLKTNEWSPLPTKAENFFPYAVAFDLDRNILVGVRPDGYWELKGSQPSWSRVAKGTPYAWHNVSEYDTINRVVVTFGSNTNSNDIWQYRPGEPIGKKMPTLGIRPPGSQALPMSFHPEKGMVALIDETLPSGKEVSRTWLYDSAKDSWKNVVGADIPFPLKMNYNLQYDPRHNLLVLVANLTGEPTAVWVLIL